ncbi:MAG: polysaccharide biosynthesis tyrosine autokinase [Rhodobacteraceae bacterium]|nr:polysaccharide biosynthesis tyrosine autokinase [Paracoccaceae bacterium]
MTLPDSNGRAALSPRMVARDDDISLLALFNILWRDKFWILLVVFLCAVVGGYYAYGLATPKFRTSTFLEFAVEEGGLLDLESIVSSLSTDETSLNTEISKLRSRETLEKLIARLNLTDDPEFNFFLREPSSVSSVRDFVKELVGLETELPELSPAKQASVELRHTTWNLRKAIQIQIQNDTHLIAITTTSASPARAAEMANTLADIYIEGRRKEKFAATEEALDWLSQQLGTLEDELSKQQNRLLVLRSETELVSQENLEALRFQVQEFRDRVKARMEDLTQAQAHLAALEAVVGQDRKLVVEAFDDAALRRLANDLDTAQAASSANALRLFDARVATVIEQQGVEIDRINRDVQALVEAYQTLEEKNATQAKNLQRLEQMQRKLNVTQDLLQTFLQGVQEVTVQAGLVRADTRIMSRALPPLRSAAANGYLIMAASGVLGGFLMAMALFLREAVISRIRSEKDLEDLTGLPVLGQMPLFPNRSRKSLIPYAMTHPTSHAMESVRNLRTSVLMSSAGEKPVQVIMLTSSTPGEGKTTLSILLALNLAGIKSRILLVEGDIRRQTLSAYFPGSDAEQGLVDVIKGDVALKDAIYNDEKTGLEVLMGQYSAENPADVFSSSGFEQFIAGARETYDYIIIDTPPVLAVPDSRIISSHADATLYAVHWDRTPRAQISEGLRQFQMINQTVTGLVLSMVNPRGQRRYGYSSGYGAYGYGSSSYYNS